MGTRLYPNTQNVANLETLAGVAPGTAKRLEEMEARHAEEKKTVRGEAHYDLEYEQWKEIDADQDLGNYSAFLLYGWGKFNGQGLAKGYAGSLEDENKIRALFDSNGIYVDVSLCEGVHWS